ncbi:porin [Vreelandella venusta]|uniref:porin n=1 Tax=Vreelandella venusta TaxID=44935 RepID=UPI0038503583
MKKTLLATAIVGALGASAAAQAATVYDQDGTKLDVYGRIAMGIEGGGPDDGGAIDNGAEFIDVFSRLGLRMSQEVTSDLTAFGRVEWRFRGDDRTDLSNPSDSGFNEIRQSYIGLQSKQFGTFQAGNFDAFYNQFVSLPFDVYINQGLEFSGHTKQSRGDSIGYYTPDLNGFTAALQAKHYSVRGDAEPAGDSTVAAQGAVRYAQGPVTIGLGFVDDVVEGGGNDEMLYGLIGSYDINDQFSVRLGYETRDNNEALGNGSNGFDKVGLGGTYATGPWAFTADVYDIDEDGAAGVDRTSWALGSYYKVSSNFDVFVELYQADQQSVSFDIGGGDIIDVQRSDDDDIYYLTGARYHF